MAVRAAIASGNFTNAATWGLVDSTSYLNSETGSDVLTTAYSGTRSSAFTPGAITVYAILVKLSVRIGTTGTISVNLELDADDSQVAGTEVTINCADLPVAATADLNGGWICFKLATPVLLTAATAYQLAAKTSSSNQVSLFRDGTTDNLSRALITSTTGAPAAGDDLIIAGEKTAAGAETALTVTMDNTASTDFGAASTSLVTPALAICDGGTLTWGTTAATNYLLKISGNLIIYSDGRMNMGTSGTRCPADSTMTLLFDCGSNVDFGLVRRNDGILHQYGATKTTWTLLTADEAAGQTVIGSVGDTTGWLAGDELAFAPTTRTASEAESKIISTVDSATAVTLTAGLTNAHSGTNDANGDIRAEIANLTRNVKVIGVSATVQTYIDSKGTGDWLADYVEFKWMGSATANKRGIDVGNLTGTLSITNCSMHEFEVATSSMFQPTSNAAVVGTISGCCLYRSGGQGISLLTNVGTIVCTDNCVIRCPTSGVSNTGISGWTITTVTFTGNRISGSSNDGMSFNPNGQLTLAGPADTGTFDSNVFHSNAGDGLEFSNSGVLGTISNCRFWRNGGFGINVTSSSHTGGEFVFDTIIVFGNTNNCQVSGKNIIFKSPNIQGGATFVAALGFSGTMQCTILNGSIGNVTAHSTADILISSGLNLHRVELYNTTLGSSTEVANVTNLSIGHQIISLKHDSVAGSHKAWKNNGRTSGGASLETDTSIFSGASPSLRMYPGHATYKLESSVLEGVVLNGRALTVSIKVRESVVGDGTNYNGNRIRLLVKRNVAAGISSDTVLATATASSVGNWETLIGTTPIVTDDAVLEFVVDCDGTTGWINVDDFQCLSPNPKGFEFWSSQHAGPLAFSLPNLARKRVGYNEGYN